jgi:hypothetical protein
MRGSLTFSQVMNMSRVYRLVSRLNHASRRESEEHGVQLQREAEHATMQHRIVSIQAVLFLLLGAILADSLCRTTPHGVGASRDSLIHVSYVSSLTREQHKGPHDTIRAHPRCFRRSAITTCNRTRSTRLIPTAPVAVVSSAKALKHVYSTKSHKSNTVRLAQAPVASADLWVSLVRASARVIVAVICLAQQSAVPAGISLSSFATP